MAAVGPVSLEEARGVLAERLRTLDEQPPANRYGRVFVGTPAAAARPRLRRRVRARRSPSGCSRRSRARIRCCSTPRCACRSAPGCPSRTTALKSERLLLRLAVGAATTRLWLSYPRLDVSGARPRVPSFYALDVMRAITGRIPNHEELQRRRARRRAARARLAGAGGCRRGDRRARARPRDAARAARRSRTARPCAATRTTCSAERRAAPLGDDAAGRARSRAGAAGRPGRLARRHQADAGVAAARRAALLGVGAPEVRARARTSSCSRPSTGSSRTRSRSRCSGSIR